MTIYSECSKALTAENLCQELAVLRLSRYLEDSQRLLLRYGVLDEHPQQNPQVCMCMHACMYVLYVCTYVMSVCMYVMHACMYVFMHVCMYVCM